MKSLREQVADALWYLKKPGQSPEDEQKAIDILSHVAAGKKGQQLVRDIESAAEPTVTKLTDNLRGVQIAIIVGHEPGGGATGERTYNKKVAKFMVEILEDAGVEVFYYKHKTRSYNRRQDEMRAAVKAAQPNNFICFELHYDDVSYPSANGHDFFYYSAKGKLLAQCCQKRFSSRFPQSKPRGNPTRTGIRERRKGNGAGFLRKAPGIAILAEPFFRSNPQERKFFADKHFEIAQVNCAGIIDFTLSQK